MLETETTAQYLSTNKIFQTSKFIDSATMPFFGDFFMNICPSICPSHIIYGHISHSLWEKKRFVRPNTKSHLFKTEIVSYRIIDAYHSMEFNPKEIEWLRHFLSLLTTIVCFNCLFFFFWWDRNGSDKHNTNTNWIQTLVELCRMVPNIALLSFGSFGPWFYNEKVLHCERSKSSSH